MFSCPFLDYPRSALPGRATPSNAAPGPTLPVHAKLKRKSLRAWKMGRRLWNWELTTISHAGNDLLPNSGSPKAMSFMEMIIAGFCILSTQNLCTSLTIPLY